MKWFWLIFKQNQPIHISSVKWGVVDETEIFIPGWTMWGALTNQYLKINGFIEVESAKKLFERITNFYPAIGPKLETCEENNFKRIQYLLYPEYERGVFGFKRRILNRGVHERGDFISKDEFKFEFVDTIVSTAVEPLSRKAKDESLHEFEFVLPKSKQEGDSSKHLYWTGLIGFENNENYTIEVENFFKKISLKVYIGGNVRYGFGELELVGINRLDTEAGSGQELKEWGLDENGCLCLDSSNNLILRHFLEFTQELRFEGEIKLIAEFDFTQNIPKVIDANYFINVGSIIDKTSAGDKTFKKYRLFKGKLTKID